MIKKNKDELNDIEYLVTQENGTEPPFQNEYWNHFEKGIYVDKLSGKPLFTSEDKFESNCGWPSFSKALNDDEIVELVDKLELKFDQKKRIATWDMFLMTDLKKKVV